MDEHPRLQHELLAALTPAELADRLLRLQPLTGALLAAGTVEEVTDAMVTAIVTDLGAAEAWVCLLDATGTTFEVVGHVGAVAQTIEAWRSFPRAADLPAGTALDRREAVVWQSLEDRDRDYPVLRGVEMAHETYIIAPLAADDTEVGVAVFGFAGPRTISPADTAFVQAAADQAAQAIHRCRLLEDHRRAHEWQRLLADAGVLLGEAGLDYKRLLGKVARLAVPTLADGCVVHLVDDEGLKPVATAHAHSGRRELLDALIAREPVVRNRQLRSVAETGESLVLRVVEDALLDDIVEDAEHRRLLEQFGIVSGIAVALQSRDRVLGTLTLINNDPARRLGAEHLAVAEELAARASLAMESARMHEEVADLADQLQQALDTRVVLEQAKGVLAERYGIHPEDAFQHLRSAARRSQRKIHELARELVEATGGSEKR
jgi:GAF domain-containing protein